MKKDSKEKKDQKIIAEIKTAIHYERLADLKKMARHLHKNRKKAHEIVARINHSLLDSPVSFRWFPAKKNRCGKLLIRSQSVGLLIDAVPDSPSAGMKLTPDEEAPFCSLEVKNVLSSLAAQVSNSNYDL